MPAVECPRLIEGAQLPIARHVIYRTTGGRVLRHGWVLTAAALGPFDSGTETDITDETLMAPGTLYKWNGSAIVADGPRLYPIMLPGVEDEADTLVNPTADWPVTTPAPFGPDTNDGEQMVRTFDDTVPMGVGRRFTTVPVGVEYLRIMNKARPEVAPGAAKVAVHTIRGVTINATFGSWSSAYKLTNLAIPDDENWQTFTEDILLSTIELTPGQEGYIEYARDPDDVEDTLAGDLTTGPFEWDFV